MDIDLSDFTSGTGGYKIFGASGSDKLGVAVGAAGDVNGDGIDDIVIGSSAATASGRTTAGITYVIFGQDQSTTTFVDLDLNTFTTGSAGIRIFGAVANDQLGFGVGKAGDVDGDGFDDIITGAPGASTNAGMGYLIFGKASFSADVNLASFSSGVDGFKIAGAASSQLGQSVSGAGDVNGDGYDDVIFGAPMESPSSRTNAGAVYVI